MALARVPRQDRSLHRTSAPPRADLSGAGRGRDADGDALNRRTALVTGAGRGIGRATAERLAADGIQVLAVSRTAAELETLDAEWIAADLAEAGECARVVAEAERRIGRIDILVNNAGLGSAGEGWVWEQDPERWRRSLALNLDAPFELTRLVLRGMIERRFGRIVMVASLASLAAGVVPGMSAYAASKHGLLGFARAVAVEVAGYGVTCNAVLPGSVRTRTSELKVAEEAERARQSVDEAWTVRATGTYARRLVEPKEVAAAIRFLVSDEASAINGEALGVSLQPYG